MTRKPSSIFFPSHQLVFRLALLSFLVLLIWPSVTVLADSLPGEEPVGKAGSCGGSATDLCLGPNRFQVNVRWRDFAGNTGQGQVVPFGSVDSGLFWFFDADNWEMLVKVLDGCALNNHFWVFSAATTNVEYSLVVKDTLTGRSKSYFNPLGRSAPAITDTQALPVCRARAGAPPPATSGGSLSTTVSPSPPALASATPVGNCTAGNTNLCLNDSRFRVEVSWRDFAGNTGSGRVVPFGSNDSGLFWFFDADNWEMLVKVLDGCALNGHFWVFSAATTNVEYTLRVTDTENGIQKTYFNPLGRAAPAITDTEAFSCTDLPPDPGEEGRRTLEGIDSDGDGVRDDLQRHIALTYSDSPATIAALRQSARSLQDAMQEAASTSGAFENATALDRSLECLFFIRSADGAEIYSTLMAEAVNTEQRLNAYLEHDGHLGGGTFPLRDFGEWAQSCEFNPAALGVEASYTPKVTAGCGPSETTVFFGNGIMNTRADAMASLFVLAIRLQYELPDAELDRMAFKLAYNPSQNFFVDLWEAVRQRLNLDARRFLRYLANLDAMPGFLQDAILVVEVEATEQAVVNNQTLQNHVDFYKARILEGSRVIVVAHSQGNFFANQAYAALTAEERRSFGIVSVANPDTEVAGNGRYTNLLEDLVIGLQQLLFGALPWNVSNGSMLRIDPFGHSFIWAYMYPLSPSERHILNNFKTMLDIVEYPAGGADAGVITVTLTWGSQPDVDLHVFEPNGEHVYYANRIGESGYLDVDDVTSYGPEHYFVSCDTLEAGTYRIGVNYYRGSAPEIARVQIEAGVLVRNYQIPLSESRGSAGNANPIPVANVIVTGSQEQGFHFRIQ